MSQSRLAKGFLVDYATSVLGILGATLIPAYVALYLVNGLSFIRIRYVAAAAIGLSFWFFLDTILDSTELGVNSGFTGGISQAGLLIAFILAIITLAIFDNYAVPEEKSSSTINVVSTKRPNNLLLYLIPVAVAAVMGIHGLGEGWDFGSAAAPAPASLVDAFGGWGAVASYPIHKFLEASIIGVVYSAYVGRSELPKAKWHLPVLGLFFWLPSVIGAAMGYYVSLDTTYFFAFGFAAAFYAVIRLVEVMHPQNFRIGETAPSYLGWKIFLALAVGFLLFYTAALLHS